LLVSRADRRPFLLPANICPIVPITFLKAGMSFKFVDISPASLHMDLGAAGDLLRSGRFSGLLYAHTYGEPSTPHDFFATIKSVDPSLLLVDDRCLCLPDLAMPETEADVVLYSTGYAKIVDIGFGGYAFLQPELSYMSHRLPFSADDLEALEKAYKGSVTSREPFVYQDSDWLETEANLPDWSSYRRRVKSALDVSLAHRSEINTVYVSCLPDEIQLPAEYQTWRFNIRVSGRDGLLSDIFAGGLFASAHYASLAGIMAPGTCLNAEELASHVINLFNGVCPTFYTPGNSAS
jgi:hypothetical protein